MQCVGERLVCAANAAGIQEGELAAGRGMRLGWVADAAGVEGVEWGGVGCRAGAGGGTGRLPCALNHAAEAAGSPCPQAIYENFDFRLARQYGFC